MFLFFLHFCTDSRNTLSGKRTKIRILQDWPKVSKNWENRLFLNSSNIHSREFSFHMAPSCVIAVAHWALDIWPPKHRQWQRLYVDILNRFRCVKIIINLWRKNRECVNPVQSDGRTCRGRRCHHTARHSIRTKEAVLLNFGISQSRANL
jgi:hypothetical protein